MSRLADAKARLRGLWQLPGAPAAALLAGLVFLFQPAVVYRGSEPLFHFGLHQMSLMFVPGFLLGFAALLALAAAGGPRWRAVAATILAGLAAATWMNANFVPPSRGLIDGRSLLQLATDSQVAANLALFAAVFAAGAFAWRRYPVATGRLFAALFAVFAVQYAWFAAQSEHSWREPAQVERLTHLSSERNVLVLLLDAFQSDFFTEIVEREPKLAQAYAGFTHFPNAVGSAMTTYLAIPTIHSGVPILDGKGIRALYQREVVEDSFVASLAASGYDAMLANPILGRCPAGTRCEHTDTIVHGRFVQMLDAVIFLANMSVFRMAPHAAKPAIYRDGRWWAPWRLSSEFARTSNAALDRLAREMRSGAPAPTVRFLHLFSSHGPATFDAACRSVQDPAWNRPSAMAQAHCAARKVAGVLDALRDRGIYDQTAIVVLADHGSGLPRDEASGFLLGAGASPLLLAKPFGSRGPLRVSERVVGLSDVAATVCAWTADCRSKSGGDVMAESARAPAYPFITYVWEAGYYGADEVPFDNRFEVRGPPRAVASWVRLSNLPERTRELEFDGNDPAGTYGFGWSGFEVYEGRSLRWAVNDQSDLYLDLDPAADQKLRMALRTHDGNPGQRLVVEVNGVRVGEVAVGIPWSEQEVTVPREVISAGPDRILFRSAKASSPAAFDPRKLAVLFDRLAVHPL